jgi:hypothetical protein
MSSERRSKPGRKPGPKTSRSTEGYSLKVYLSTAEEARLDRYTQQHGISRAQAVRSALEALYREERAQMSSTTQQYAGWTVQYGFLAGDLFDGWPSADIESLDIPASIDRYATQCEIALQRAFPSAEIVVAYENGSGILPHNLRTAVYPPQGHPEQEEDQGDLEAMAEEVASSVYHAQSWLVPAQQSA